MGKLRILAHIAAVCSLCILVSTYTLYNPEILPPSQWRSVNEPYPSDTADNLFWFVQVSDIHISRYLGLDRAPDFKRFCTVTLDIINPDLVLVTGDLTDAKTKDKVGSKQYEDEWITYDRIIQESNVTEKYIWLDIRGNHDAFDVLDVDDPNSNFYIKYSGDRGRITSKVYHHKKSFGKYSFIPVDATLIPGPKRPYNFIGYMDKKRMRKLVNESGEDYSNFTIWYSHYPTSTITSSEPGLTSVIGGKGGVYVAGHLHTLQGLDHEMYAMNPKGFLELELADWMNNRRFRIMALDHDFLSFTDAKHGEWPIIVVTNPKPAKYMMPITEPLGRMSKSTHIRFLIFDVADVVGVEIYIDGSLMREKARRIEKTPLWVCRWDPTLYVKGMHNLTIVVLNNNNETRKVTESFSLDSTWEVHFHTVSVIALLTDFSTLFYYSFRVLSMLFLAAIVAARFYQQDNSHESTIIKKICLLMKSDTIFKGIVIFALNLAWGPWFVGEIITGTIGICFSFGLLIDGVIQPEYLLYVYGVVMIVLFYIPCILYLAHWNYQERLKRRSQRVDQRTNRDKILLATFLIYVLVHLKWCWAVVQAYGVMAGILCPSRFWWLCFVLFSIHKIRSPVMHSI